MPVLHDAKEYFAVQADDILFDFNAQHDCTPGQCMIGESDKAVVQERIVTETRQRRVLHNGDNCFLVNTHALHNAHRLRMTLPRSLIAPVHVQTNRVAFHSSLSDDLQVSGAAKRAETQEKAKATREKKKAAKAAAEVSGTGGG
ncbi:hypothetical protein VKT23_002714 [Stygiomarasmius scandens]|uniref:Uncharacterized protein n=1 Tax=Marasmiellus scandens TaxID=2682957 RepID=A0ABR1K6B1_9AGAR